MTTAQAMFSPLSAEEIANSEPTAASTTSTKTPIIPVPDDAPPCNFRHPVHGDPTGRWPWHDAAGRLIGYTYRFDFERDGEHDKELLPVTYCTITEGDRTYRAWRAKGIPAPRPLYRLPQLLAETAKPIIFTEGEKKADRALELFPDFASTTTMGGADAPHLTDFSPVAGKPVVIWPDHDPQREELRD